MSPANTAPLSCTVARARELTGLGNTTLWALIKDGTLTTTMVGRRRLIRYDSLERLIRGEQAAA